VVTQQQAAAVAAGALKPKYIITDPEGNVKEFSDYGLAAIHRENVNGTMTTTTA